MRDELATTLPAEDVLTTDAVENSIGRDGSDTAQFDGTVTVTVDAPFDRAAWLDEAAASYTDRPGWRVKKKVDVDGSSDAMQRPQTYSVSKPVTGRSLSHRVQLEFAGRGTLAKRLPRMRG